MIVFFHYIPSYPFPSCRLNGLRFPLPILEGWKLTVQWKPKSLYDSYKRLSPGDSIQNKETILCSFAWRSKVLLCVSR